MKGRTIAIILASLASAVCVIAFLFVRETIIPPRPGNVTHHAAPLPKGERDEVVFDLSYSQMSSPFDTGFAGMSMIAAELRKRGVAVSVNSMPLHRMLEEFRGPGRVLVLGVPAVLPARYRARDIAAIRSFVAGGGGLLAIVEHDNAYDNHRFQGDLIRHFDIEADQENAFGSGHDPNSMLWPRSTALAWGFRNIRLYYAATLKIGPKARPFTRVNAPASREHSLHGAINTSGKGPVVVLGDYEILWNMTPESGIRYGDNMAFLMKTFDLLRAGNGGGARQTGDPVSGGGLNLSGSRGMILFSGAGLGLVPDASVSGLWRFAMKLHDAGFGVTTEDDSAPGGHFDCIVIACPVETIETASVAGRAGKLLLAADGLSSTMEADDAMRDYLAGIQKNHGLSYNPREYEYPLNGLAAPMGIIFPPVTLLSAKVTNQFEVESRWVEGRRGFTLMRGAAIDPAHGVFPEGMRVLARTREGAWRGKNFFGPFLGPGIVHRYGPGKEKTGAFPVAVSSSRLFAIADVESLTNAHVDTPEGEALLAMIIDWLGRDR